MAHEQELTSESRSCIEYLTPSDNMFDPLCLRKNLISVAGFNAI